MDTHDHRSWSSKEKEEKYKTSAFWLRGILPQGPDRITVTPYTHYLRFSGLFL